MITPPATAPARTRRALRRGLALAALCGAGAGAAHAQVPEAACLDRGGRPVLTVFGDSLPYAAWAHLEPDGRPVITWNTSRTGGASASIQQMVYLHECAHHVLGHVGKFSPLDMKREFEREADCWAIQRMVEGEMVTTLGLETMEAEIRRWTGDLTHQGGEVLVRTLRQCLADKTDRVKWHRFLDALVVSSRDTFAGIRGDLIPESGDEQVREAIINAPGTFNCDIRGGRVMVCPIFLGVREAAARRRYRDIERILQRWLGPGWRSMTRDQPEFQQPRVLLAWDETTGMNFSLVLTNTHRLFFTFGAVQPDGAP